MVLESHSGIGTSLTPHWAPKHSREYIWDHSKSSQFNSRELNWAWGQINSLSLRGGQFGLVPELLPGVKLGQGQFNSRESFWDKGGVNLGPFPK